MTKQETIKQHYITEFINSGMSEQEAEQKWEEISEFVDADGFAKSKELNPIDLSIPFKNILSKDFGCGVLWRPKSLDGIETNNGWTSILSEKDLPKEYDYFHLKLQSGDEIIAYNSMHRRLFVDCDDEIEYRFITHYAPIEKKLPPLH